MTNIKSKGDWVCQYCGLIFITRSKLREHFKTHPEIWTETGKRKQIHNKNKILFICRYCKREKITTKEGNTNHENYCKLNPNRRITIKPKLTDEHKQKISKYMKLAHLEGRAWNIGKSRWNNQPSYPEKWFMEVIKNEFFDKNYSYEHPLGIYSLDFAWIHKNKCIEIDGEQH